MQTLHLEYWRAQYFASTWRLVITFSSSYLRHRQEDSVLWVTVSLQRCALVPEGKVRQTLDMFDGPESGHGSDDDGGDGDGACQTRPFRARFAV